MWSGRLSLSSKKSIKFICDTIQPSHDCDLLYLKDPKRYGKWTAAIECDQTLASRWKVHHKGGSECFAPANAVLTLKELASSLRTVQLILSSSENLQFKKPKKQSPLAAEHTNAHIQWARDRHEQTSDLWGFCYFFR